MILAPLTVVAAGCDRGVADGAGRRLQDAVSALSRANSFQVQITNEAHSETATELTYQAPDSIRVVQTFGAGRIETIAIGTDVYSSVPGQPGAFLREARPERQSLASYVPVLEILMKANRAHGAIDALRFRAPPNAYGEVQIVQGFLSQVLLRYETTVGRENPGRTIYRFGNVNAAPPIEPPAP